MTMRNFMPNPNWERTQVKTYRTLTRRVGSHVLSVVETDNIERMPSFSHITCVVCGNTYPVKLILKDGSSMWPRRTKEGKHDKVCANDIKHVSPENVHRYLKNGKHNKYN